MTPGNVSLSHPVSGYGVIVIDDLYQSGVTMWSYARLLKSAGAAEVLGLTCQKSIRDTDNL
jgi:predicted amidophosphoribosyltransferase